MDAETAYRINEQRHRERLAEFKASPALDSLAEEIALVRAMIEGALNDGKANSAPLVWDLVALLSQLVKVHRAQKIEDSLTLERSALGKFTAAIVEILAGELQGVPQFESVIDRVTARLGEALAHLDNKPGESKAIETNGRRTAVRAK